MIKSNELRLGNLLELNNPIFRPKETSSIVSVHKIHPDVIGISIGEEHFAQLVQYLNPIPLSEEKLLKLGLEKVEDLGDMVYFQMPNIKFGYGVCYDHECWVFYKFSSNGHSPLIYDEPYFQHVHHLQNIWFALTGEELTVKK